MASIKVFPRLDKISSNGKVPIYLRVTKHRKSKYIALDVRVSLKDWNEKTSEVVASATNASIINNYISFKVAEAEKISLELETKSKSVTSCNIRSKILGKAPSDFFAFFVSRESIMDREYSIGTIRRYRCVVEKLKIFCKRERLYFDDITVSLMKDFQQYLLDDCKNQINTVNANLKVIRRLIADAIAEELMPVDKNPFNKIKLRFQPTKREFLLDDELEKIENLDLVKTYQINHHRNMFVFSAYACGIRIADLLLMRWENISGDHLHFQIRKNQEQLGIKLPIKAQAILRFYQELAAKKRGNEEVHPRSFIFPVIRLDYFETDKRKIHNAISSATSYTNKDLRKIKVLAGLSKDISFHIARHSWAVRALQKGMRIEYVSKLMGHASVKHTEVYAKILDSELDKAMQVFN